MMTEQRILIMESSLKIERNLSILLSNLLVINDIDSSKTLGNKSSALSFNQKADLLLDTDFISENDRKKFQLFMELRNQFAHNKNCETFIDCTRLINGSETRLNNFYPFTDINIETEEKFKTQISSLLNDLYLILNVCQQKIIETLKEYVDAELNSYSWQELRESFMKNLVRLDKLIDFPIEPENVEKLRKILFTRIMEDAVKSLNAKSEIIVKKMAKRKLKHIE